MIEPRCYRYGFKTYSGATHWQLNTSPYNGQREPDYVEPLTTVTDVLAALRESSEEMIEAGYNACNGGEDDAHQAMKDIFLAMLDQFERDQGSAT